MELHSNRHLTSILLNNIDDAVILADVNGCIVVINDAAESITDWKKKDAEGRKIDAVLNFQNKEQRIDLKNDFIQTFSTGNRTEPFTFESVLIKRSGAENSVKCKVIPLFDDENKASGTLMILREISRFNKNVDRHVITKKPAENHSSRTSECPLCLLINSIPESIFLFDRTGIILEANDAFALRFGKKHEECIGKSVYTFFPKEVAEKRKEMVLEVMRTGKRMTFESEDNNAWRVHNITPIKDMEGVIQQFVVYSLDITELKQSRKNLISSQLSLDADLKAMSKLQEISMLYVREGNLQEIFKKVIAVALEISGADMGNIRLIDPESGHLKITEQQGFDQPLKEFCNYTGEGDCLCDMAMKRNERFVIEDITQSPLVGNKTELEEHLAAGVHAVQSIPLKNRNSDLLGILSIYYRAANHPDKRLLTMLELLANQTADIMERAEKEEVLRQSEEHRRLAQDAAKSGSWCTDLSTSRSFWSEELWELYGLEPGICEPSYKSWISSIHPDYREEVAREAQKAMREGTELQVEWLVKDTSKGERWMMSRGRPIFNASGKPVKMIGVVMDITERKQSEKLLLESNERHRSLFNNTLNAVAYCRMIFENGLPVDFVHEDVNARFSLMTGLRDVIGRKATELVPDIREENPEFFEKLAWVVKSGLPDRFEMYFKSLNIWLDIMVYRHKEACFVAVFDVITARKLTEQALQESERKFRSITEKMTEVVFLIDAEGHVTYVSDAAEKMFGYNVQEEVLGHSFSEFLAEEEVSKGMNIFQNVLKEQLNDQLVELKFRKKNGIKFFGECHIRYYQDQEHPGLIGLIRDITDRKNIDAKRREYEQKLLESRQFLQSIYDAVNHSIFVVDVHAGGKFRFRGINRNNEIQSGFSNDEIAGKTPEELFDPSIAREINGHFEECLKKGRTIQFEEKRMFNGKETFWETSLNPLRNDAGYIDRIIGTSTNITERKLAEEELKKLSVAVQQSPAVVVITDPDGNIEYANPTFTEHTGYTLEEARGQNPRILQSGMMPKEIYENLWKTILSGKVWYGEFHNKKKNGELYWEEAVVSAIRNEKGIITNFVAVKEDITEKKKLWEELVAAKEKAEESDRLKSAFLANISHEIRTPMNGILGFSELLKEPHLSGEEQQEYIALIQQSGERMLNLINDLIDISRIEAGETLLQVSETHINKQLQDLHAFFRLQTEKKGLMLVCRPGLPDTKDTIETDETKLIQVMTNLIQNALKFTHEGQIEFGYRKNQDMLEFYVSDTGIGIPAEQKDNVFDRFRQLDNSLTRNHEGSGLGLCISKAYIEMLGGSIWVESGSDKGSKFVFTLPYNPPGSKKSASKKNIRNMQGAPDPSPGLTILLAEDDEVSRLLLTRTLQGDNIIVISAGNGHEAVELVRQHPETDIVLMDIKMPFMNGYDATRMIKQIRPDLPVIAQTAFSSEDDRTKAEEAGCDGFITKPVKKNELFDLMRELLKA